MLFNSFTFICIFLPATVVAYYVLPRQGQRVALLVGASYVFYAWATWWFPLLMVASTAVAFTAALAVERLPAGRQRKLALAAGIVGCLALLGYFKYTEFGAHYLSRVVSGLTGTGLPSLEDFARGIVLPAGISFFTFECVSYLVDVHRAHLPAERNPLRFALFISFFPHLIAGPIVRYGQLQPQLLVRVPFDADRFRAGLLLFSLGLAKKVLVADQLAIRIDPLLARPEQLGALDGWVAMFAYSFQIYFDFSAYSDMALGLASMLGIELPWNFDRPYRATGLRDFWRRWHVTLSSWLRDYLYVPLGGNRRGPLRRDANIFATMGLGGLWHGANWSFVLWGLYHGSLLVGERRLSALPVRLPRFVSVAVTFVLVTVGWVFFRLTTPGGIGQMLGALAGRHGVGDWKPILLVYLGVCALLMWGVPEERTWRVREWGSLRLAAAAVLTAAAVISMNETRTFLYFRF